MADDHERDEPAGDETTYEPPAVEPLGSADELAQGNEGSATDTAPD